MSNYNKIFLLAASTKKAKNALTSLRQKYNFHDDINSADLIIALGGDGFMLHTIHKFMNLNIPIYGMNCGTVGFLMNKYKETNLSDYLSKAKMETLHPLKMEAHTNNGKIFSYLAINEVSLLRSSRQAAHLQIAIDDKIRIKDLVCDGALVATAAGSTAYNLSVHGPIIPIGSNLIALTPISPFRPRRWKGALLRSHTKVTIDIINHETRPVNVAADFNEVQNISRVIIHEDKTKVINILFDPDHSLEERIISEQFVD